MSEAAQSKSGLRVDDFDFHLPPELIAQQPPVERGLSRMLVMDRAGVVAAADRLGVFVLGVDPGSDGLPVDGALP